MPTNSQRTSTPETATQRQERCSRRDEASPSVGRALLIIGFVLSLLPVGAFAQPEGGAVIVERKQSYHLGELWVWQDADGQIGVRGHMAPLFEMEMTVLNVTPSKVAKKVKPEKGSWNGTIGEPIPIDTVLRGALPVLVRMNYRKFDRIDTKRQFHRIRVQEIPSHDRGAVRVECHLADDEEVRCSQSVSTRPSRP